MAFPRRLLIEGEELVLDLRPHPVALLRAALVTLLVLVGWVFILRNLPSGSLHQFLFWLTLGAGLVLFVWWPVRDFVRFVTSHFVVTSDRVIHREGWVAKRSMEIPLEAINDVRFQQNVFERMIGAGDILISSASERGTEVFQDIRHPEEVQKTIYAQGELNQKRMYHGMGSGPAPAAPQAPSVTGELERLSQLRDKGVLTEAEFQNQKKKILGQ
jgi:membrane protein YdbS with pleckstrin-like domain